MINRNLIVFKTIKEISGNCVFGSGTVTRRNQSISFSFFFSDADGASTSTPLSSNSNSPVRDTDHVADHHDDAHSAPPGGEEVNQHTELISIPVKPINNNIPSNNSLPRMGKDQFTSNGGEGETVN